jgi:hypothetical protein
LSPAERELGALAPQYCSCGSPPQRCLKFARIGRKCLGNCGVSGLLPYGRKEDRRGTSHDAAEWSPSIISMKRLAGDKQLHLVTLLAAAENFRFCLEYRSIIRLLLVRLPSHGSSSRQRVKVTITNE